tara:strand:- start:373 stop:570 length:198 start_codon:yes stop_codon:yes gene_type:complete
MIKIVVSPTLNLIYVFVYFITNFNNPVLILYHQWQSLRLRDKEAEVEMRPYDATQTATVGQSQAW